MAEATPPPYPVESAAQEKTTIAYHFELSGSFDEQIREIARYQTEHALASLDAVEADPEGSIHDARKRFKKVRGLLRLLRPGLGKTYSKENAFFRDLGRSLSATRDAQVFWETMVRLQEQFEHRLPQPMMASLRGWAGEKRQRLSRKEVVVGANTCAVSLRRVLERIGGWRIEGDPLEASIGGYSRTYKRAQQEYRICRQGGRPEDRHEWRKRVKYHWYHCRLLREAWPDVMTARANDLKTLADALGEDRDLTMLLEAAKSERVPNLSSVEIGLLDGLVRERSDTRRNDALALAPKLLSDNPKELQKRIRSYWMLSAAHEEAGVS